MAGVSHQALVASYAGAVPPSIFGTPVVTTGTTSSTTKSVVLPASTPAGSTILFKIAVSSGSANTMTASGGFVAVSGAAQATTTMNGSVFYKIADGSEGGTTITVTLSSASTSHVAEAYCVTGASTSTPPEAASTTGSSTTPDPPSLSPSWGSANNLWFAGYGSRLNSTSVSAYPTNYTLGRASGVANIVSAAMAARTASAASEDPGTFAVGGVSVNWYGVTVALKPA